MIPAILILGLLSCNDDDDDANNQNEMDQSMVGIWQLTSQYQDDGGGTGTWVSVQNGKVITVNADGTWFCNVSICNGSLTLATSNGTYTAEEFISTECTNAYDFSNDTLDLLYSCIEPCTGRYTRI
jgi:hypothetical protein